MDDSEPLMGLALIAWLKQVTKEHGDLPVHGYWRGGPMDEPLTMRSVRIYDAWENFGGTELIAPKRIIIDC